MVNAGLLPATVADEGLADFVARIFDNIVVHKDLAVSGPNSIAWAFRKDSSQLAAAVNGFVAQAHKGTRTGNIVLHKYLKSTKDRKSTSLNSSHYCESRMPSSA